MNPAILYARFSPRPKGKADKCESIEVQIDGCQRYCALADLEIRHTIRDEFTSAAKQPFADRPGGQEAIKILQNGCRDLVVLRLDRIFRNVQDGCHWLDRFDAMGVRLHFANEGGVAMNVGTATGRATAQMLLVMAEFNPRITQERTSEAMRHHQANGRRMGRKDRVPYGSQLDADDPSRLVDDMFEQETIRGMLLQAKMGRPAGFIAANLNAIGETFRGKPFTASIVGRILKREARD